MSIGRLFCIVCGGISLATSVVLVSAFLALHNGPISGADEAALPGVVGVLALLALWLGSMVTRPLRRRLYYLEEAASLIAAGHLQYRVPTMGDTDEIGRVTEQFNIMGDKIQQQVGVLQKLAEENRVLAAEAEQVATLSERQRLAQELHDSVSQQLFAITMLSGTAQRQFEKQATGLSQTLHQLADLSSAAQREMRALLLQLRPVELDGRNLREAAASFLDAVEERHGMRCTFEYSVDKELSVNMEEQLFRILQEAVSNVLKHAEATEIRVRVSMEKHLLLFSVMDNGKGIDESRPTPDDSYGIRAMHERAARLGGRCDILRREQGTAVEVRIPIVDVETGGQ